MKALAIFLFLFNGLLVFPQNEKLTKELRPFTQIKAFDGLSVNVIQANENKAVITGVNTKKVAVVNNNGVLKLRMEIDKLFSGYRTFIDLYCTEELKVLDANEDARIYAEKPFVQQVLELKAQEGGELVVKCQVEQLLVKSVTGGDVSTMGFSKNQDIIINTGGSYDGKEFKTEFTTISVNAGGNAKVYATEYVQANVKAGGEVEVFGNPSKLDEKRVFGGKIKRMD